MTVRRTTIALTVAAVLLAILFFAVPVLIKVDRYRPQVISYLQQKTGKQIEIQRLGLTFFPLSIRVDGFGIVNPPLFPRGYVVHVARIDAALDAAALRHRQVVIKSLVLDNPVIHLISDPDGPWNFENPQRSWIRSASARPDTLPSARPDSGNARRHQVRRTTSRAPRMRCCQARTARLLSNTSNLTTGEGCGRE